MLFIASRLPASAALRNHRAAAEKSRSMPRPANEFIPSVIIAPTSPSLAARVSSSVERVSTPATIDGSADPVISAMRTTSTIPGIDVRMLASEIRTEILGRSFAAPARICLRKLFDAQLRVGLAGFFLFECLEELHLRPSGVLALPQTPPDQER